MLILVTALGLSKTCSPQSHVRASYYADRFEGHRMANGSRFHQRLISAASRTYPLGTVLEVTSLSSGLTIRCEVTDRGPWGTRYKLDLSRAAWSALGLNPASGWGWVSISPVSPEFF